MSQEPSKLEAVRLAREHLGEAPAQELAHFVEVKYGLKLKPAIVTVLLASLREREQLQASKQRAQELLARARAEQAGAQAGRRRASAVEG
jgi:hypothetical protein